jgi:photosystem II stability/assembly factor-like uncharacterized protein
MKKYFLLFVFCYSLFLTHYSFSQWELQSSGVTNSLFDVAFYNDTLGIAVGEQGRILKTSDGGISWNTVNLTIGIYFKCVKFATISTIFAMGYYGYIIKSTNYGNRWVIQSSPTSMQINGLSFYSTVGAYATGYSGILLKTTNTGTNWTYSWLTNSMLDIHMFNATTGIVCGNGGSIYKTTNNGNSWIQRSINTTVDLNSMAFLNSTTGVMVGSEGNIFTTTNGGNTWKLQDSAYLTTNTLYKVAYPSANRITAVGGSGVIITSTNGGVNWSIQESGTSVSLYGVYFRDANNGCAVGESGVVLTTTNGGSVFVNNISSEVPNKYSLYQNYPNPFNPSTIIRFKIKDSRFVTLKIYDILGKEITTLVNENLKVGIYETTFDGSGLTSGIYFYKLEVADPTGRTGNFIETKKMLMIK